MTLVIFDQWPKLNLGFNVEPETRIWKVIYCSNIVLNLDKNNVPNTDPACTCIVLKVSKFQKQIFLFSFEPKNKQIYF
jgi:hypothetical protein